MKTTFLSLIVVLLYGTFVYSQGNTAPTSSESILALSDEPVHQQVLWVAPSSDNTTYIQWQKQILSQEGFFEIQHSTDGIHYELVGLLSGALAMQSDWQRFTHSSPKDGVNYYRVIEKDKEGRDVWETQAAQVTHDIAPLKVSMPEVENQEIVKVMFQTSQPEQVKLTLQQDGGKDEVVYFVTGLNGVNQVFIPVDTFKDGKYILTVEANNNVVYRHFEIDRKAKKPKVPRA